MISNVKQENRVLEFMTNWKEGWAIQSKRRKAKNLASPPSAPRSFEPQFPRSQQLE